MDKLRQHSITNISNIFLTGYKSIIDLNIQFAPQLNILIGRNGTGKTNLLHFIHQSLQFSYPLQEALTIELHFHTPNQHHYIWKVDSQASKQTNKQKQKNAFLTPTAIQVNENLIKDGNSLYQETYTQTDKYQQEIVNRSFQIFSRTQLIQATHYITFDRPTNLVFLDRPGRVIIKPPRKIDHSPTKNGYKFVQTLISILIKQLLLLPALPSEETKMLNELLSQQIPNTLKEHLKQYSPIKDIRFAPEMLTYQSKGEIVCTNLVFEFLINNKWLRWQNLSDASRRLFQIISDVSFHDQQVFLIEEPELGLDLRNQDAISKFLIQQAQQKQIILSTNTPRILDNLELNQLHNIFVCQLINEQTHISKLTDTHKQKISHAKKAGTPISEWWYNSPYYQ